ncbi:MAG: DUF4743 domain-containing protein [Gammaproteobacteria bacterium]|nr:DUF4743 domain-containing protein [Gammaproteobacteria bacterium]
MALLTVAGRPRGRLTPGTVAALVQMPQWFAPVAGGYALRDDGLAVPARSALLQEIALALRERGLVPGWRDEHCALLDANEGELARFERGAFRTLGLQNRAVHVNGCLPDGRLWIARRSARKASSPNKLDNMAAGAIAAGETPAQCTVRELWEEAGVPAEIAVLARFTGTRLRSERPLRHGFHDEVILCADLELPAGFVPVCQDGEVAEFLCLDRSAIAGALADGEFSVEAGLVVRDWLGRSA